MCVCIDISMTTRNRNPKLAPLTYIYIYIIYICILPEPRPQVITVLESEDRLKAAIYFNSLKSMISPYVNTSYPSTELAPTLQKMLDLPVFTVNDYPSA